MLHVPHGLARTLLCVITLLTPQPELPGQAPPGTMPDAPAV